MGVPAFFRWLSRKYPSIIVNCVEEKPKECNGVKIPVDASKPNPNDVEFDNLYLDMNGIIHPCTHPEDKPAPKNEDEMMVAIFEYIDRLFNIVRPRRLLYMAIDGVAPRAKMNQQRSRRFRASKEGMEAAVEKQRVREEILAKGGFLPPEEIKERFDSNCITPGTEFMDNLAKCLRYYIADRLNNDPSGILTPHALGSRNSPGCQVASNPERSVGAEPLLPWNRMIQNQNAAFQPNQYQMLGGPGGYPPRRDDHRGGRQGYPREGRKYPLPPPSGRYSWN